MPARSRSTGACSGPRSSGRAASRSTPRAMPSSSPSRCDGGRGCGRARRRRRLGCRARSRYGWASTRGAPVVAEEGYVGMDVHRAARIMRRWPRRAGARLGGDRSSPRRSARAACPRCPPSEGLGRRRARSTSSGPATSRRSRASTRRTSRSRRRRSSAVSASSPSVLSLLARRRHPPRDADRPRRLGQDAARRCRRPPRSSRRYPDGVWWVALAASARPELGSADDRRDARGEGRRSPSTSARPAAAARARQLRAARSSAAPSVARLLAACPKLRLLVTSREPLRLGGEQRVRRCSPLAPDGGRRALPRPRARGEARTSSRAATVAEICRRLDHLPLAIELAAARLRALSARAAARRGSSNACPC